MLARRHTLRGGGREGTSLREPEVPDVSCPRCDRPVASDARFCLACGAPLGDAPGVEPAAAEGTGTIDPAPQSSAPARAATGDDGSPDTPPPGAGPPPPTGGTSTLVSCPACGAPNSDARMLCGRCGADLATGRLGADEEVVRPGEVVDVAGEVDVGSRGDRRRTAVVAATIVVVGALVGVAVGVWAVRAGQPEEPAAPSFDEAVYPGEVVDLEVAGIGATSTRPASDDVSYSSSNLVDGDVTTVWSHDPATEAATEVDLAFDLDEPAWITELLVANGSQADDASFAAAGRVRTALLGVGEDTVAQLQLLDRPGFQRIVLPEPVLPDDVVRLVVTDVFDGDTFEEVSMSEVVFRGHLAVGEDRNRARAADG